MEIKCLKCGEILFRTVPLDNKGNMAIDHKGPKNYTLKNDGTDEYFECSKCKAKNVISLAPSKKNELPQSRIIHIKE
jgi:hypothetical protein